MPVLLAIPLFTFGVLVLAIYYLYNKTRKTMLVLKEKELAYERRLAQEQAAQSVTVMMIDSLSRYNAEIQDWIATRKAAGQQPPLRVEEASRKIGQALNAMTELSFVAPYTGERGEYRYDDYTRVLRERLDEIEQPRV